MICEKRIQTPLPLGNSAEVAPAISNVPPPAVTEGLAEDQSKTCTKCRKEKPLEDFNKNKSFRDGLAYECRLCAGASFRDYKARNLASVRAKNRAYFLRKPIEERRKQKRGRRDPFKATSKRLFEAALKRREIHKPEACSRCGAVVRLHGHHADYSKPLLVVWLCQTCHAFIHRKPL